MNVKDLVTKYRNDVKNSGFLGSWILNETKFPFMTYYDQNHNQILTSTTTSTSLQF